MDMEWKMSMGSALRAGLKYGLLVSLGAISCAAVLTEEEQKRVKDFESIHGFALARLFFNLLGDDGTLQCAASQEIEPVGLWITAAAALVPIYENCFVPDPFTGGDKKLGEVNYLNYRTSSFSLSISLVPLGAGEFGNPRPFEISTPGVVGLIPLIKQKQIKNAAITYNGRFCSPENLKTLGSADDEIMAAFSGNLDQDEILKLSQNFLSQHILYVAGRLVPGSSTQEQMQTAALVMGMLQQVELQDFLGRDPSRLNPLLRPFHVFFTGSLLAAGMTGLIPQDHTREFPLHIIALFNLAQSLKILGAFLRTWPLSTLKGLALDEVDTSARGLISTYEIMVAEVIEYLKSLDNSLFELFNYP
jgi:hypothetical protein